MTPSQAQRQAMQVEWLQSAVTAQNRRPQSIAGSLNVRSHSQDIYAALSRVAALVNELYEVARAPGIEPAGKRRLLVVADRIASQEKELRELWAGE